MSLFNNWNFPNAHSKKKPKPPGPRGGYQGGSPFPRGLGTHFAQPRPPQQFFGITGTAVNLHAKIDSGLRQLT